MRLELVTNVLGFVLLNLLLVFASIGLFTRMGPAVDHILTRNDATIGAVEEILSTLVLTGSGAADAAHVTRVNSAFQRALDNITEAGEREVLERISPLLEPALQADLEARTRLVAELDQLSRLNREAMRRADAKAQRLGRAGAWAALFVGVATLALGLVLAQRLETRVRRPLQELRDTLVAAGAGDRFRRCGNFRASVELRQAMAAANQLLDAEDALSFTAEPAQPAATAD